MTQRPQGPTENAEGGGMKTVPITFSVSNKVSLLLIGSNTFYWRV
jgi:hypothetical protein